jgi:hypothetical protein
MLDLISEVDDRVSRSLGNGDVGRKPDGRRRAAVGPQVNGRGDLSGGPVTMARQPVPVEIEPGISVSRQERAVADPLDVRLHGEERRIQRGVAPVAVGTGRLAIVFGLAPPVPQEKDIVEHPRQALVDQPTGDNVSMLGEIRRHAVRLVRWQATAAPDSAPPSLAHRLAYPRSVNFTGEDITVVDAEVPELSQLSG